MYGSQFQVEQALTILRPSTQALYSSRSNKVVKNKKILGFIFIILIISSVSLIANAGSSQPKLAGGNGSASGR